MDWSNCAVVEREPGRPNGAWLFRGTRIPVHALFEGLESGASVDDFLEWFPGVTRQQVDTVLEYVAAGLRAVEAPEGNMMDKTDALRAILYEAAVLGAALLALRASPPRNDVGRGTDQLAVEAALVKFRSLHSLLYGQTTNDDLTLSELGTWRPLDSPSKGEMKRLRRSINKYCAHISRKRAKEDWPNFFLPRPPQFESMCREILLQSWRLIEVLREAGCDMNEHATKYYNHLRETIEWAQQDESTVHSEAGPSAPSDET